LEVLVIQRPLAHVPGVENHTADTRIVQEIGEGRLGMEPGSVMGPHAALEHQIGPFPSQGFLDRIDGIGGIVRVYPVSQYLPGEVAGVAEHPTEGGALVDDHAFRVDDGDHVAGVLGQ
jgi:hypothetical protein